MRALTLVLLIACCIIAFLGVNDICKQVGAKNVLLVSIHNNAAGADGKWHTARGFSAHVGLNASSKSKTLAQYLWNEAIAQGLKGNRSVPAAPYISQNLAICRDTLALPY